MFHLVSYKCFSLNQFILKLGGFYKNERVWINEKSSDYQKTIKKRRNDRKWGENTEDYYFKETVSTDSYTGSKVVVSRDWWRRGGAKLFHLHLHLFLPLNPLVLLTMWYRRTKVKYIWWWFDYHKTITKSQIITITNNTSK